MVQHFLLKSTQIWQRFTQRNKLPDLRGEFIRGWDDGRGIDSGRSILSEQGYATGSLLTDYRQNHRSN